MPSCTSSRHRPDRLLDRRVRVDPVLVVEIDVVDAEALEAAFDRLPHVVRAAVDPSAPWGRGALDAELGGDHDAVAPALDGAADEFLVGVRAVHVGRVEEGDAELERAVDGGDRLGLVPAGVELAHPHAAQPDGGDLGAILA